MDSVLDFLFLRRLRFEYTTPPICPITLGSGSGSTIPGQIIAPPGQFPTPTLSGTFLSWGCHSVDVCYNVYKLVNGALVEISTCIPKGSIRVSSAGCWSFQPLYGANPPGPSCNDVPGAPGTPPIPGPVSAPVCIDGSVPVDIALTQDPNIVSYNIFKDGVLVFAGAMCSGDEIPDPGCYAVSAITVDGETAPSEVVCNTGLPELTITAPINGSTFYIPGSEAFSATAILHDHAAQKVDFFDDGSLIGSVPAPGPYSVAWTPTTVGAHTLEALLTYDNNRTVPASIIVNTAHSLALALEAYWKLEEGLGQTRIDSIGTNDLNEKLVASSSPTITNGFGKILDGAHVPGGTFGLAIPDNAVVGMNPGESFTLTCWGYWTSFNPFNDNNLISKGFQGGADYRLTYLPGDVNPNTWAPTGGGVNGLKFVTSNPAGGAIVASTIDLLFTNLGWWFVAAGYDDVAKQIWLYMNNGTVEDYQVAACPNGVSRNALANNPFILCADSDDTLPYPWQNNVLDEVGLWKRTLSISELRTLCNSGNGLPLASFYP